MLARGLLTASVSPCYCREFDFRYNTRDLPDADRAIAAVAGARGKRLMYRQSGSLAA